MAVLHTDKLYHGEAVAIDMAFSAVLAYVRGQISAEYRDPPLTLALTLTLTLTLTLPLTLSLSLSLLVPLSLAVTLTLEGGPNELGRRELARRWHLRRATGAHSGRSCTRARPTARCSTKSTCDEPSPCRSFCEFNNQHEHPRSSRVSSEIVACIW